MKRGNIFASLSTLLILTPIFLYFNGVWKNVGKSHSKNFNNNNVSYLKLIEPRLSKKVGGHYWYAARISAKKIF